MAKEPRQRKPSQAKRTPISFVRGGQVSIHFFRMARQVFRWSLLSAFVVALSYWLFRAALWTEFYDWYLAYETARSDTIWVLTKKIDAPYQYWSRDWERVYTTLGEFKDNPVFIDNYLYMWELTTAWALQSLIAAAIASIASIIGFIFIGSGLDETSRVRGSMLVSVAELKFFVDMKWRRWRKERNKDENDEYVYTLAGVRYPPDAPMVHTMMVGTPGSGKTVAINELLAQIREKGDCAVIYDRMGAFTSAWFDKETDFILNPFDDRDAGWTPFADARSGADFANMAAALIPTAKGGEDPFWSRSAQSVFANIAEKLAKEGDTKISTLRRLLMEDDLATLSAFCVGTPAAALINEANEKTALSIRATLIPQVEFLKHMKDDDDLFSIRRWIHDQPKGGSFMFLSGHVDYLNATRNLISVAIETAANSTMSLDPIDRPRIWFVIDELPSLNYLPFLGSSLAEIRQFGGCFVVGYQVFSQLRDVYGPDMAETISGTVNNRLIFSVGDHATAERCAKSLGKEDIEEKNEGMSLGANETRDGVTIQERRIDRDIVTPSQIMDLPRLHAYLRFGYDAPRSLVEFEYVKYETRAPKLIPVGTTPPEDLPQVKRQQQDAAQTKADLPPEERRHREDMFLAEHREWLKGLTEPDSPFAAKQADAIATLDTPERKAFFLKQRLTGVALDDVKDLAPDYPPSDPEANAAYFARLDYQQDCLNHFYRRREEERENPEILPPAPKAQAVATVEIIDPETGEVTAAEDMPAKPTSNACDVSVSDVELDLDDSDNDQKEEVAALAISSEPVDETGNDKLLNETPSRCPALRAQHLMEWMN